MDATFLGQVPAEQIPQLISDSDMFLVPTSGETFFLGAAEAIAAGRPVVTGSYGGTQISLIRRFVPWLVGVTR